MPRIPVSRRSFRRDFHIRVRSSSSPHLRRTLSACALLLSVMVTLGTLCGCSERKTTGPPALPVLATAVDTLDFGIVRLSGISERSVTVTNAGSGVLQGTAALDSCGTFRCIEGCGAYALTSGDRLRIRIRFEPVEPGEARCDLRLAADRSVFCTGRATTPDTCLVAPTLLAFDTIGVGRPSEPRGFVIRNLGTADLPVEVQTDSPEFTLLSGSGASRIAPGGADTVTVAFRPSRTGPHTGMIRVGGACGWVTCTGVGVDFTECTIIPEALSFDTTAIGTQSEPRSFTIRNTGTLRLAGEAASGSPEFVVVAGALYDLGPGEEHQASIAFRPGGCGNRSGSIVPGGACASVPCSGAGTGIEGCTVSPAFVDVGDVPIGETGDAPFRLSNPGCTALWGQLAFDCPDFSVVGSPIYRLEPGQVREVLVRFTPWTEGEQSCSIDIGSPCGPVLCRGRGVAPQTTIRRVRPDGSGDFPTIRAALDASAPGDTIELTNGIFRGPGNTGLSWNMAVTIRSQSGFPEACVIDCEGAGRFAEVPHVAGQEYLPRALRGVLITNGTSDSGGALSIGAVTLTIDDCVFSGNRAAAGGAVLCGWGGSTVLSGCVFLDNTADSGGAIRQTAGGACRIEGCTFVGNGAPSGPVLAAAQQDTGDRARVEHSILAFNSGGEPVACESGVLWVSCSDVVGNEGGDWTGCLAGLEGMNGNIAADPGFCDRAGRDFRILADSPCAPQQNPECGLIGAAGIGCAAGAPTPSLGAGARGPLLRARSSGQQ